MKNGYYWIKNIETSKTEIVEVKEDRVSFFFDSHLYKLIQLPEYEFTGEVQFHDEQAESLKANCMRLADHHRQHCDGETCNISLYPLVSLMRSAGIEVTSEELSHFM